jgi:DNA-binding PadR family transcriptional regulator
MKHRDMRWHMAGPPFGPGGGHHPGDGPYFGAGPRLGGIAHFAGGPFGGGRGRKRRGDVRTALLLVLAEEPRNGYQLMQEIEERSGGRWRPSPGSVYPALAQLEDERLVRAIERDEVKLFEITDEGRKHLEERHEHTPPWEDDESVTVSDLKSQIKQVAIAAAQVMQAGSEEQVSQAGETLAEARRKLYRILAEEDGG